MNIVYPKIFYGCYLVQNVVQSGIVNSSNSFCSTLAILFFFKKKKEQEGENSQNPITSKKVGKYALMQTE